jgi:LacI family transcriptional regulator, gluconate utilization system Gnt-I transcriptional repressor
MTRTTSLARAGRPRHRRKMQRVTMDEVARLAEVSPSTVSLYLRKPTAVTPDTGARIARAVEKLHYVPSLVAGGLAAASSRVVGVIVPSVRNAFFADTVAKLQDALGAEGLQLLLGHSEYSLQQEEALVRAALSWSPAAIVLAGLDHSRSTTQLLLGAEVPVVEIWELGERPIDMAVGFSHHQVGRAAVEHLHGRGCRHIAFLGARMEQDGRARQRAQGYARFLADRRLDARVLERPGAASPESGAVLLRSALQELPHLDGIVCSNDLIALGALFECQRSGIAVPSQLAVIGFGDLPFAGQCIPPLTTVRPPGAVIGQRVAELILRHARDGSIPERDRVVDTSFELIERASSARSSQSKSAAGSSRKRNSVS